MNNKELNILSKIHLWPLLKDVNYKIEKSNISDYKFCKEINGNTFWCTGGTYVKPKGLAIVCPAFHIKIPKFNNVINGYFEKFDVRKIEDSHFCDASSKGRKNELADFMSSYGINSEEDFLIWLPYFKNYMTEIVEPFFKRSTTMKGLNELIETRKNEEDLRTSLGTTNAWMKKLFILKVNNNPNYPVFADWYLNLYTNIKANEDPSWENHCNACFALYDDLEKGIWDDFTL
jgi:hypothetical protein